GTLELACQRASSETRRIVSVANANSPEQFVISGELQALNRAIELISQAGARRVFPLRISIASHSPLMQQAAMRLAEIIDRSPLRDPQVPVVTNLAGQVRSPYRSGNNERVWLSRGVSSSRGWAPSAP